MTAISREHSPITSSVDEAQLVWRAVVPLLAGGRAMRVSKDGGQQYRRRDQRRVTETLPNQPAAVLVYDRDGCAPVFCIDLDSSKGGVDAVDRDFRSLTAIFSRSGLTRWFSDRSPNGGRHIYVPLAQPAPFTEARAVALALAAMTPTLDASPMRSIESGCLRPPGARHRTGGHQVLDGPVEAAVAALRAPNPPQAWQKLMTELRIDSEAPAAHDPAFGRFEGDDVAEQLEPLRGWTEPDADFQRIARTGEYPAKYATDSEARQGVVWSAAACGFAFTDLVRRLEDGTWRGLAALYARYPAAHRHRAVARDWREAITFEKRRRQAGQESSVRVRPTSALKTHRGAHRGPTTNQETRAWLAAVDLLLGPGTDPSQRAVLYALAGFAVIKDSLVLEVGNRSLAIATGLDHRSVGRALNKLRDEPSDRGLVDLVRPARNVHADAYQLIIPPLLRAACEAKSWRRGRIHGIRPVFRELGLSAAFVYAALEQLDEPVGGRELAALARLSPSATYEALACLAEWGLAERVDGGWIRGDASLGALAEAWGITDAIREQLERFRAERHAWREWLSTRGNVVPIGVHPDYSPPPPAEPPDWLPPDPAYDDHATLLELLERVLGARPVSA